MTDASSLLPASLAPSILSLATKAQKPPTWIWMVFGGLIVFCVLFYIRYLLAKKAAALAEARTSLARNLLAAQQAKLAAVVQKDENIRREAEAAAKVALDLAAAEEKALAALEEQHRIEVAQVQAVAEGDWEKLNKLAGIP